MATKGSEDYGARVRATMAYAGLSDEQAAAAMGFSVRTLERVKTNERELSVGEAKALAERANVPLDFLTGGWETQVAGGLQREVTAIRQELGELIEQRRRAQERIASFPPEDVELAHDFLIALRQLELRSGGEVPQSGPRARVAMDHLRGRAEDSA